MAVALDAYWKKGGGVVTTPTGVIEPPVLVRLTVTRRDPGDPSGLPITPTSEVSSLVTGDPVLESTVNGAVFTALVKSSIVICAPLGDARPAEASRNASTTSARPRLELVSRFGTLKATGLDSSVWQRFIVATEILVTDRTSRCHSAQGPPRYADQSPASRGRSSER